MYYHVSGRLGNQLFQWSFAHLLESHYKDNPKFFVDKYHHGLLYLNPKAIELPNCIHHQDVRTLNNAGLFLKILDRYYKNRKSVKVFDCFRVFRTLDSFTVPVLPKKKPLLLTGYCINKSIVEEFEEMIFSELNEHLSSVPTFPSLPDLYQVIHVRRGDFVTSDTGYGLISAEFYRLNLESNLPIVLCTDAIEDCQSIIDEFHPTVILSPQNSTPWQAIKAMSSSSHVVLSNSTLAWWGGFIASKRGASVVIPRPFYMEAEELNNVFEFRLFSPKPAKFEPQKALNRGPFHG
jgi:hypothetical protein